MKRTLTLLIWLAGTLMGAQGDEHERREIPRSWDETALAGLEQPRLGLDGPVRHLPAKEYYRLPVRPIYRTYPVYHPDHEPAGYLEKLAEVEPETIFDSLPLETDEDWIRAGKIIFTAPIAFLHIPEGIRDPELYRELSIPTTEDHVNPFVRYVVREKGRVELGIGACANCHTRVLPNGEVVLGAQSNHPLDRVAYDNLRRVSKRAPDLERFLAERRRIELTRFAVPWLKTDPNARLGEISLEEIIAAHEAIPAGVFARHGDSPFHPAKVPSLIGVKDRRYLDKSGIARHREIGDLMRYAALTQGMDFHSRYGGFRLDPAGQIGADARYSDEQLYALALYIYSLEPPENPEPPDAALVARGERVFELEGCVKCHTPPLYTNNELVAAPGFRVPKDHPERASIMRQRVGTDPGLTVNTRRGTGLYKVPSLRGLWYGGPFGHSGSLATLEDWFDPARLEDDYRPYWNPPGVTQRAVPGHEFGLDLEPEDRAALIAFLKSL